MNRYRYSYECESYEEKSVSSKKLNRVCPLSGTNVEELLRKLTDHAVLTAQSALIKLISADSC
jgi:arsenate reductase-like glutaredoxin family protein